RLAWRSARRRTPRSSILHCDVVSTGAFGAFGSCASAHRSVCQSGFGKMSMCRLIQSIFAVAAICCCLPSHAQTASESSADALSALTQLLVESEDAQFQLDILKGMSDGLKGRRGVKMPAGWEDIAAKLAKSSNPQVRELIQSLSLTFGSASALSGFKQTLMDPKADRKARESALAALLAAKDASLVSSL